MRLDIYLSEYWPEKSRAEWQRLIKSGFVSVDSEIVTKSKFNLGEDSFVDFNLPETPDFSKETLPVLYKDENVVVIDKPEGVLTHAKGKLVEEFTVADFMLEYTSGMPKGNRVGIVHRLDRDTSGVIICARNQEASSYLQRQFSEKKVKKTYLAIVDGKPKKSRAIIKLPIERNPKVMSRFRVSANGKPAETHYRVLWNSDQKTLVELKPITGRTHQLRVHMAYINTPITGDRFYCKPGDKIPRLGLHAYKLEITVPGGRRKVFKSNIPDSLKKTLPKEAWNEFS